MNTPTPPPPPDLLRTAKRISPPFWSNVQDSASLSPKGSDTSSERTTRALLTTSKANDTYRFGKFAGKKTLLLLLMLQLHTACENERQLSQLQKWEAGGGPHRYTRWMCTVEHKASCEKAFCRVVLKTMAAFKLEGTVGLQASHCLICATTLSILPFSRAENSAAAKNKKTCKNGKWSGCNTNVCSLQIQNKQGLKMVGWLAETLKACWARNVFSSVCKHQHNSGRAPHKHTCTAQS